MTKQDIYYNKYMKYKKKYLEIVRKTKNIQMIGGEKIDNINDLERIINKKFQSMFKSYNNPKEHIFFYSNDWYKKMIDLWKKQENDFTEEYIKKEGKAIEKYSYKENKENKENKEIEAVKNCNYKPKETLTAKKIIEYYDRTTDKNIDKYTEIKKMIDEMFDYNLPSTIDNLEIYLERMKKSDAINIIIVGAGPVGLYTALYLDRYYNNYYIQQRVNILLIDNRISEEGVKLPYTRVTQFGFDISQFQPFIPQLFCYKDTLQGDDVRQFGHISDLENLLYINAFKKNIGMYFTKKYEKYDDLKEMASKYNINYILDCTGGRLENKLEGNIKWNDLEFKKGNYEVKYIGNNMYKFYADDIEYKHYTVVLTLLDSNFKPFQTGNIFSQAVEEDLYLIEKYQNKCYLKDDYIELSRQFKNKNLRYYYPKIIEFTGIDEKNIKYVKLSTFNSNSHHVNRVAKALDKNLMYIGLGDTLGSSEYGIHFGMKNGIAFSQYVCNTIDVFKNLKD
jgi:hypothetical protein